MTTQSITESDLAAPRGQRSARPLAASLLTGACYGGLTLLNGHLVETVYGWPDLGRALADVMVDQEIDVLECQFGPGPRHELVAHMDEEFMTSYFDRDDDLYIVPPDWESEAYDAFNADDLSDRLSSFGSNSLPGFARCLARTNDMIGALCVLLLAPACARPYGPILARQRQISDPVVRAGAMAATYRWLAEDLAVFAAERPAAPTIVVCDDRDPEWDSLSGRAALVLP